MKEKQFFHIYKKGEYPKAKKIFVDGEFETRRKARQFCKNRPIYEWVIVHPNGKEEIIA
ncbi:MAG: hypothetical protein WC373_05210 [Smithella sp.]|jgi:hypothetical protein